MIMVVMMMMMMCTVELISVRMWSSVASFKARASPLRFALQLRNCMWFHECLSHKSGLHHLRYVALD